MEEKEDDRLDDETEWRLCCKPRRFIHPSFYLAAEEEEAAAHHQQQIVSPQPYHPSPDSSAEPSDAPHHAHVSAPESPPAAGIPSMDNAVARWNAAPPVVETGLIEPRAPNRKSYYGSLVQIETLKYIRCCPRFCLNGFETCQLQLARKEFKARFKSAKKRKQWFLDYYNDEEQSDGTVVFRFKDSAICQTAFYSLYDFSKATFHRYASDFKEGVRKAIDPRKGFPRDNSKIYDVLAFLQRFVNHNAEFMPNSEQAHLPSITSLDTLYQKDYIPSLPNSQDRVGYAFFRIIFRKHFGKRVKILKHSGLSKCDLCCQFKAEIRACSRSDKRRLEQLKEQAHYHIVHQRCQRNAFKEKVFEGIDDPESLLTWHSDGMDQTKSRVPTFLLPYSGLSQCPQIEVHCFGVWTFGRDLKVKTDFKEYSHNTSQNLTALVESLHQYRHNLSRKLHVQLDNTASQNKNAHAFSFFAYLIQAGIFWEITCYFLQKGHTHSHLDRFFGSVATKLRCSDTVSMAELVRKIETCFHARDEAPNGEEIELTPVVEPFEKIWDIKGWLLPHQEGLINLGYYHCFKFVMDDRLGKCVMFYKPWVQSAWRPTPKVVLKSQPSGVPDLHVPNFHHKHLDIPAVQQTLLKGKQLSAVNARQMEEWDDWIKKQRKREEEYSKLKQFKKNKDDKYLFCKSPDDRWLMDDVIEAVEARRYREANEPVVEVPPPILGLPDETNLPPVLNKKELLKSYIASDVDIQKDLDVGKFIVMVPDMEICVQYAEEEKTNFCPIEVPWVGKVTNVYEEGAMFDLLWYKGTYDGPWTTTGKDFGEGFETECVQQWNFNLRKGSHKKREAWKLPTHIKKQLKIHNAAHSLDYYSQLPEHLRDKWKPKVTEKDLALLAAEPKPLPKMGPMREAAIAGARGMDSEDDNSDDEDLQTLKRIQAKRSSKPPPAPTAASKKKKTQE